MQKGRIVLCDIKNSAKLCNLKVADSRWLYMLMLIHADRMGNYKGDADDVKYDLMARLGYDIVHVQKCLDEMEKIGLISFYESENHHYVHIENFDKTPGINPKKEAIRCPLHPEKIGESAKKKDIVSSAEQLYFEFTTLYEKKTGNPYISNKISDTDKFNTLLSSFKDEKIIHRMMEYFFDGNDFAERKAGYTVAAFFSQANVIAEDMPKVSTKPPKKTDIKEALKYITDKHSAITDEDVVVSGSQKELMESILGYVGISQFKKMVDHYYKTVSNPSISEFIKDAEDINTSM